MYKYNKIGKINWKWFYLLVLLTSCAKQQFENRNAPFKPSWEFNYSYKSPTYPSKEWMDKVNTEFQSVYILSSILSDSIWTPNNPQRNTSTKILRAKSINKEIHPTDTSGHYQENKDRSEYKPIDQEFLRFGLSNFIKLMHCNFKTTINPILFSDRTNLIVDSINEAMPRRRYGAMTTEKPANYALKFFTLVVSNDSTGSVLLDCSDSSDRKPYETYISYNIIPAITNHTFIVAISLNARNMYFLSPQSITYKTDCQRLFRTYLNEEFSGFTKHPEIYKAFYEIILYSEYAPENVKFIKGRGNKIQLSFYSKNKKRNYTIKSFYSIPSEYKIIPR